MKLNWFEWLRPLLDRQSTFGQRQTTPAKKAMAANNARMQPSRKVYEKIQNNLARQCADTHSLKNGDFAAGVARPV
jgi:hypothetical protein